MLKNLKQSAESTVSRSEPYSFSVSGETRSIFRQQRRLVTFHPGPRSIFPQSISQWLGPLARLGMTVLDHAPEFSDVQHAVRLLHVQNCLYLGLRLLHSLLVEDLVQVVRQSGCLLKNSEISRLSATHSHHFMQNAVHHPPPPLKKNQPPKR